MSPVNRRIGRPAPALLALALLAAMSASGCGRRGPPEAPPSAAVPSKAEIAKDPSLAPPPKRFILDPLID